MKKVLFFLLSVLILRGITICNAQDSLKTATSAAAKNENMPLTFVIHSSEGLLHGWNLRSLLLPKGGWGALQAEFEKRGFKCIIIRSPGTEWQAKPNQDRAKAMVEALKNIKGDIALVGVSNEGLFMPLVAAQRPIRRIVMINAVIPQPGKSFKESFDYNKVFRYGMTRWIANRAPGLNEVCPLKELPKVEWVYICGEKDDQIRPEWEQMAARKYLHVEPIIIKGAGHSNIIRGKYAGEVVDAATKGFR
jgi:predicted esterase YcpF (UPF0227 family)